MHTTLKLSLSTLALACAAMAHAADRQIGVDPMLSVHWGTLTGGPTTPAAQMGNHMMVGFWQRSSGAKAGVGSINQRNHGGKNCVHGCKRIARPSR